MTIRLPGAAAVCMVALALLTSAAPAGAAGNGTGVRGRVLDTTCFGPCLDNMVPRPYAGEATIVSHRLGSRGRTRRATVRDGRFRQRLSPGRYRLIPRIDDSCWSTTPRDVRVREGVMKRIRLTVGNTCIR